MWFCDTHGAGAREETETCCFLNRTNREYCSSHLVGWTCVDDPRSAAKLKGERMRVGGGLNIPPGCSLAQNMESTREAVLPASHHAISKYCAATLARENCRIRPRSEGARKRPGQVLTRGWCDLAIEQEPEQKTRVKGEASRSKPCFRFDTFARANDM